MWIIMIGIGMIALTVAIHTLGATSWLSYISNRFVHKDRKTLLSLFHTVAESTIVLLSLHMLEACLWAFMYLQLPTKAGLNNLHDAFYFSMITLTTLGYGDITLATDWQVLSGMEAMVGIVVFGLTTAILFAIIQKGWQVRHSD